MAINVMKQSRKLLDKLLKVREEDSNYMYLYSEPNIGDAIINSRFLGCAFDNNDTSISLSMFKDTEGKEYVRFLYQIKVQVNGRVKNIDSVMSLINDFEHEFVFADKIDVVQDAGVVYVDIYKRKTE